MLMVFRAESLFTWDEYVRVNRHTDEDDDSDDGAAAEDMQTLTVQRDTCRRASWLKFDLDLPAAATTTPRWAPASCCRNGTTSASAWWPTTPASSPCCRATPPPAALPERLLPAGADGCAASFQALAPERMRKQAKPGPDIDLDRLVRFLAERASGAAVAGRRRIKPGRPAGAAWPACCWPIFRCPPKAGWATPAR